jgi:hypothetical protein
MRRACELAEPCHMDETACDPRPVLANVYQQWLEVERAMGIENTAGVH